MFNDRIHRLEVLLRRLSSVGRGTILPPQRLQKLEDVINVLEEQVEAIRADSSVGTLEKARVIGYLASIAARVMHSHTLAERIEILEAVLRVRKEEVQR